MFYSTARSRLPGSVNTFWNKHHDSDGSSLLTGISSGWPCAVLELKYKLLLPGSCVSRPIEYTCQVSLPSAQRYRSLQVLKMLTPHGRTDRWTDIWPVLLHNDDLVIAAIQDINGLLSFCVTYWCCDETGTRSAFRFVCLYYGTYFLSCQRCSLDCSLDLAWLIDLEFQVIVDRWCNRQCI